MPLNFNQKSDYTKDAICDAFGYGLKKGPQSAHIKIMRTAANVQPFISHVRKAMENETNKKLKERVEDYINNTLYLQKNKTKKNRFFYIFEYEGKSTNLEDIYVEMAEITGAVTNALHNSGNVVVDYQNDPIPLADIYYCFFNPKTSREKPFEERMEKVREAREFYRLNEGAEYIPPDTDYLAPRGLIFGKYEHLIMDGMYHTYLSLKDDSFPQYSYAGHLATELMAGLDDCDLDIYYKEQNRDTSLYLLDRAKTVSLGVATNFNASNDKQENLLSTADNAKYLRERMKKNNEDLYDVAIILTIRAETLKQLRFIKSSYIRNMKSNSYYFESCFMKTQKYFEMVMPLMNIHSDIFKENKRNMTNDSMSTLYCFTSYEMFDYKGACMGYIKGSNTLYSLDNFDTTKYTNPHISLLGTSGSGKTYTELMLTNRFYMHGSRIIYVLPLKGHEYRDSVLSMGGAFVSLRPGGKSCINIMEIRPEAKPVLDGLSDADVDEDVIESYSASLLSKKIESVITWFRLLCGDDRLTAEESGELNSLLQKIYEDYGFTEDNDSIYDADGNIKPMPIIGDLFDSMLENELLRKRASILKAWVTGNCKNMNAQTNVDLSNRMIAFDINEDIIGKDLLPGFMYIAFEYGYSICKMDDYETCCIALDEVWKLLKIDACAEQVFKMIKILRSYASACITATQDISDYLKNEYGRAIMTNSAIKIILKVEPAEYDLIESNLSILSGNKEALVNAQQGTGFVTYKTEKLFIEFKSSELEEELYTTDINVKRRLREKRLQKLQQTNSAIA